MATEPAAKQLPPRLVSLDAYRGFIMLAMASEGFAFAHVAGSLKSSGFWQAVNYQFSHVTWQGCAFWDLIQPSFMFMAGVAIPYSHARRVEKGEPPARIAFHVILRSLLLILLGIFLSSDGSKQTNFTFVNVLTQIGLGYGIVYLLRGRGLMVQLLSVLVVLGGYWLWFATYPLPAADFDYGEVGVPSKWQHYSGLFAHWDKNTNAAAGFDERFMNLFPRPRAFKFNSGGYQTLNFIPSIATMIFGLMAGELLRSDRRSRAKLGYLVLAGAVCLVVGLTLGETVCPIVKRIWTPSWAVFSTGWTLWMLAAFYLVIDLGGWRRWAFPLVVVGMNSIVMYCLAQLTREWTSHTLRTHFGKLAAQAGEVLQAPFAQLSSSIEAKWGIQLGQDIFVYGPVLTAASVLFVWWLICLWLYRRRIFIRI